MGCKQIVSNIQKKSKINTWKILCVLWLCFDKIYLKELEQVELLGLPYHFSFLILDMLTLCVYNKQLTDHLIDYFDDQ